MMKMMKAYAWLFFFFFILLNTSQASEHILTPGYDLMTRTRDKEVKNNNLDDTIMGSERGEDDKRYEGVQEILRAKGSYGGSDVLHKRPKSSRAISLAARHDSFIPIIICTKLLLHLTIGVLL